jgi:hypothetical protein
MRTNQWGASLQADWDLGFATATSITAYRYWHFNPLQDSDNKPLDIIQANVAQTRNRQVSQELRLAPNGDRRLIWQIGGYYFHQHLLDHISSTGSAPTPRPSTLLIGASPIPMRRRCRSRPARNISMTWTPASTAPPHSARPTSS